MSVWEHQELETRVGLQFVASVVATSFLMLSDVGKLKASQSPSHKVVVNQTVVVFTC